MLRELKDNIFAKPTIIRALWKAKWFGKLTRISGFWKAGIRESLVTRSPIVQTIVHGRQNSTLLEHSRGKTMVYLKLNKTKRRTEIDWGGGIPTADITCLSKGCQMQKRVKSFESGGKYRMTRRWSNCNEGNGRENERLTKIGGAVAPRQHNATLVRTKTSIFLFFCKQQNTLMFRRENKNANFGMENHNRKCIWRIHADMLNLNAHFQGAFWAPWNSTQALKSKKSSCWQVRDVWVSNTITKYHKR